MTRITNTDQVVLLLRNQLQRMERARKKDTSKSTEKKQDISQTPLNRVASMSHQEELTDAQVHRALVGGLLTDAFGAGVANDPNFQILVDDVTRIIQDDKQGKALLQNAVIELKAQH